MKCKDKRVKASFLAQEKTDIGQLNPYGNPYRDYRGDYRISFDSNGKPCQKAQISDSNLKGNLGYGRYKGIIVLGRKSDEWKFYGEIFDPSTAFLLDNNGNTLGLNPESTKHSAFRQKADDFHCGEDIFLGIQFWIDHSGNMIKASYATGHYGGYSGGYLGDDSEGNAVFGGHEDAIERLKTMATFLADIGSSHNIILQSVKKIDFDGEIDIEEMNKKEGQSSNISYVEYGRTKKNNKILTTTVIECENIGKVSDFCNDPSVKKLQFW